LPWIDQETRGNRSRRFLLHPCTGVHDLGEALKKIRVHGDDRLVARVLKSSREIAELSVDEAS